MEFIMSFVVIVLFLNHERKITLQGFDSIIPDKRPYELLNKIFYVLYHPEEKFGNDLLFEIIEYFDIIFKIHKAENKCLNYPGIKCFCTNYSYEDFVK